MKYRRIPGEPIEAGQWGRDIRIAGLCTITAFCTKSPASAQKPI